MNLALTKEVLTKTLLLLFLTCKLLYPLSISKCLASRGILLIILSLELAFLIFFSSSDGRANYFQGP